MEVMLLELLKKQEKSIYWLSDVTGIGYSTIFNLCKNKTKSIHFDTLVKICQALECTPNDILKIK